MVEGSSRLKRAWRRWLAGLACVAALAGCTGSLGGGPDGGSGVRPTAAPDAAPSISPSTSRAATGACWVTELLADPEADACLFTLPAPPNSSTSNQYIYVSGDGIRIPRDPSRVAGWDYTDGTAQEVEVHGPPCDAIRAGAIRAITVTYYCPGLG